MKVQCYATFFCPECGNPMLGLYSDKGMVCVTPGCKEQGKAYKCPEIEVELMEPKEVPDADPK